MVLHQRSSLALLNPYIFAAQGDSISATLKQQLVDKAGVKIEKVLNRKEGLLAAAEQFDRDVRPLVAVVTDMNNTDEFISKLGRLFNTACDFGLTALDVSSFQGALRLLEPTAEKAIDELAKRI